MEHLIAPFFVKKQAYLIIFIYIDIYRYIN